VEAWDGWDQTSGNDSGTQYYSILRVYNINTCCSSSCSCGWRRHPELHNNISKQKNVLSMHMIEEENKTRKIASMSTTILEKKIANF
jgi:hypothetical protein